MMRGNQKFTLIEMLVVVAIISILTAMLAPSLMRTRVLAGMLNCKNNLRNLGCGLMAYAEDNFGHLPAKTFNNGAPRYQSILWGRRLIKNYGIDKRTFVCTENPHNASSDGLDGWELGLGRDQVTNADYECDYGRSWYALNGNLTRTKLADQGTVPGARAVNGRLAAVTTPSRSVLGLEYNVPTFIDGPKNFNATVSILTGKPEADITRDHRGNGSSIMAVDGHVENLRFGSNPRQLYFHATPAAIKDGDYRYAVIWDYLALP